MKKLVDKIPLLLCCLSVFIVEKDYTAPVICFLAAVTASSFSQAYEKRYAVIFVQVMFIILCIIKPVCFFGFPLVFYDILTTKCRPVYVLSGFGFIFAAMNLTMIQVMIILAVSFFTVILHMRTENLEAVEKKLIVTRDSSEELNIALSQKNRSLIDNQDYEIHLATLKERNRIAREIHDNVGHLLSRSILQVGAMNYVTDENMRKESLAALSDTLNNAMTTIRRSVHDLHDDSIDLRQSVNEAAEALKNKGITVKTELEISPEMDNETKFCIIGIVKEAVSNIIKHSSCDKVTIILAEHPVFRQLRIFDNGICSEEIKNSGIGLSNMRERVEKLGGIISFKSGKNGFEVFVSIKK